MPRKGFRSAFDALGPNITPAQVLAFHQLSFGGCRMSNDDGALGGGSGTGSDAGGDNGGGSGNGSGSSGDGDRGFPESTPIADMTVEQQAAYWKHQARKHESTSKARGDYDAIVKERDELRAASQTDAERAVSTAKSEAHAAGKAEARAEFAGKLVEAKLEAALAGKMPADKIAAQVEFLDHSKFLTESGEVDTDKVQQYAAGLVPAGTTWPDMGNGNRGSHTQPKGVGAGADLFAASRGKSKTTT